MLYIIFNLTTVTPSSIYFIIIIHILDVVTGESYEEIYNKVKDLIAQQSKPVVWIPSKEKL